MTRIFILTIHDQSDFGTVRHESAHASEVAAHAFAEHVAIPDVQSRTDPEWHYAFYVTVRPMEYFA